MEIPRVFFLDKYILLTCSNKIAVLILKENLRLLDHNVKIK